MDKEFKTTFIPKKSVSKGPEIETRKSRVQKSILSIIALLLFVTAAVSVVGATLYKIRLAKAVNTRIDSINRAEKAFEPAVVLELKKLDIRLRAATELLDNHVALSDFLDSLAESTLPDVSFSDFSFTYDSEAPSVSMSGEARGYLPIAQQSDVFEENQYIQNHIFSDFALTDTGNISFSLVFTIDRSLLTFGRTVKNNQVSDQLSDDVTPTVIPDSAIIQDPQSLLPESVDVDFGGFTNTDIN